MVSEGAFIGYPHITAGSGANCDVAQAGIPHLGIDVPGGAEGYVEQLVKVPAHGATLSFLAWGSLEPVSVGVIAVTGGVPHKLLEFSPSPIEGPGEGECSGKGPVKQTVDMAAYAGQEVGLRIEATSSGYNGTFANITDIALVGFIPTTTTIDCAAQTSPPGTFKCTATVTAEEDASGAPTGEVSWDVPDSTVSDEHCTLTAESSTASTCSIVVTPTQAGNEKGVMLTADYDATGTDFGSSEDDDASLTGTTTTTTTTTTASTSATTSSTGGSAGGSTSGSTPTAPPASGSTIYAVKLQTSPATVDTYLETAAQDANFKLKLSRASSTPVTVDYATQDGTGANGAKAKEGDYTPVKGVATFAPGVTEVKITVKCYADITLRKDSAFDLILSNLKGAHFEAGAQAASVNARAADNTGPRKLKVVGKIDPDLFVGEIVEIKTFGHGVGEIYIERYNTLRLFKAKRGERLYVGDKIFTGKQTVAAIEWLLGGKVGINSASKVHVVDDRTIHDDDPGLLRIVSHKIGIWGDVEHREGPARVQIQTNGGVMGQQG